MLANNPSSIPTAQAILDQLSETPEIGLRNLSDALLKRVRKGSTYDKHWVPRYLCRAILYFGTDGLEAIATSILKTDSYIYAKSMLETLWYVSEGLEPPYTMVPGAVEALECPRLTEEIINKARSLFAEFVLEAHTNDEAFIALINFVDSISKDQMLFTDADAQPNARRIFQVLTESSIKISVSLIDEFSDLINQNLREEEYQRYLALHPVFLDPLANSVIPKQALGLEHITDFVVKRLDNEFILVEIERPQDSIFTKSNDFSARFTHAYGQILDFLEWIESHGEYARSLMPGIFSPKGLLIIGSRKKLTVQQVAKLRRLNLNSRNIEVLTFDDLITKAENLHSNILRLASNKE